MALRRLDFKTILSVECSRARFEACARRTPIFGLERCIASIPFFGFRCYSLTRFEAYAERTPQFGFGALRGLDLQCVVRGRGIVLGL